ncbi:hypothetical protein EPN52_00460 [bacterium]|nr:MAG: hypothetical protein EPN52_00460 [bacterium]
MLITTAILALLALTIVGHGHPVDSRLDASEYPFFRRGSRPELRNLTYDAAPARENELREHRLARAA